VTGLDASPYAPRRRGRPYRCRAPVLAVEPSLGAACQLGQLGLVLVSGLYYGALPATLAEAAPPTVRCTAVALGYNLCVGLFGGLSPLVATWLVERTGDEIAPAFLIMAAAAVTFVTLLNFQETYRAPLGVAPRTTAAK
jgi:MHS family proline/betaine transporter-like MFS transporter